MMDDKGNIAYASTKQRPIQNFPDYLWYVAKKSKAGFDKVHEELVRLYSGMTDKSEKVPEAKQTPASSHVVPVDVKTNTHRASIRKRWTSAAKATLASTRTLRQATQTSFTSYITEDIAKEESGAETGKEFDKLSDELVSSPTQGPSKTGLLPRTAMSQLLPLRGLNNDMRCSMPYLEFTNTDSVYVNDRVVMVEKMVGSEKKTDNDELYSVPKKTCKSRASNGPDDYINLRTQPPDIQTSQFDIPDYDKPVSWKSANTTLGSKVHVSKSASREKNPPDNETSVDKEDGDYEDPEEWTDSDYTNPDDDPKLLYTTVVKKLNQNDNKHDRICDASQASSVNNCNRGNTTQTSCDINEGDDYVVPDATRKFEQQENHRQIPPLQQNLKEKNQNNQDPDIEGKGKFKTAEEIPKETTSTFANEKSGLNNKTRQKKEALSKNIDSDYCVPKPVPGQRKKSLQPEENSETKNRTVPKVFTTPIRKYVDQNDFVNNPETEKQTGDYCVPKPRSDTKFSVHIGDVQYSVPVSRPVMKPPKQAEYGDYSVPVSKASREESDYCMPVSRPDREGSETGRDYINCKEFKIPQQ